MLNKLINITKEMVARLTTQEKIARFCFLIKDIELTQEDIDRDLAHGKDD